MATPRTSSNPWYKDYGIMGVFLVIFLTVSVNTNNSISNFREETNVRLTVIELRLAELEKQEIPPPDQIAHNKKNDEDIQEIKQEFREFGERINGIMQRLHAILPALLQHLRENRPFGEGLE